MAFWIGILGVQAFSWFIPFSPGERTQLILLTGAASLFILVLFHWLSMRFSSHSWVFHLGVLGAIAMIARCICLFKPHGVNLEILYMVVVAGVGMMAGRRIAIHAAILVVLVDLLANLLRQPIPSDLRANFGLQVLALLLTGYFVGIFTGIIHEQAMQSDRRNRYLTLLLQAGMITSAPEDLCSTLSRVAEMIARDLPVTTCQIGLLDARGDRLVIYGAYPIRALADWNVQAGRNYRVDAVPDLRRILDIGSHLVLRQSQIHHERDEEAWDGLFFSGVQSICMLPLITKGVRLGVISVGELRRWEREPFSRDKINLLQTLAAQIAVAIYSARLFNESQRQAERLSVINKIMQAIGSTIELNDLLELIYEQISKVIPTDTYFVSLYDPVEDLQDMRILIDDGKRFAPARIPVGKGLNSWVVKNRRMLSIQHMSEEMDSLPVKPIQLGQDRMSESWLGVPMLVGERCLGLLAIASYTPHAFSEEDASLLGSLASQAALAVDNARQHEQVKEQARRDSLTGAYNHGHLLIKLNEQVQLGQKQGTPVSLIMLDIDYFKDYNDHFGHVVGDEVLCRLVQAIQGQVKDTGVAATLGRWGGEEFALSLPGSTREQALQVAHGIRASLAQVVLRDKSGALVSSPTVSQGIATFPYDAKDMAELVDIADEALYVAKEAGRDQVVMANGGG